MGTWEIPVQFKENSSPKGASTLNPESREDEGSISRDIQTSAIEPHEHGPILSRGWASRGPSQPACSDKLFFSVCKMQHGAVSWKRQLRDLSVPPAKSCYFSPAIRLRSLQSGLEDIVKPKEST